MKQTDIKVGAVYRNRGKGRTERRVLGIGVEFRPSERFSTEKPDPDAPGVEYQQLWGDMTIWSEPRRMWLDSFSSWAGSEVTE